MTFRFFHIAKPKQFEYKPRFYDPVVEERRERERRIREELGMTGEPAQGQRRTMVIRGQFRKSGFRRGATTEEARRKSNRRLLVLILLLAALFYFLLYR